MPIHNNYPDDSASNQNLSGGYESIAMHPSTSSKLILYPESLCSVDSHTSIPIDHDSQEVYSQEYLYHRSRDQPDIIEYTATINDCQYNRKDILRTYLISVIPFSHKMSCNRFNILKYSILKVHALFVNYQHKCQTVLSDQDIRSLSLWTPLEHRKELASSDIKELQSCLNQFKLYMDVIEPKRSCKVFKKQRFHLSVEQQQHIIVMIINVLVVPKIQSFLRYVFIKQIVDTDQHNQLLERHIGSLTSHLFSPNTMSNKLFENKFYDWYHGFLNHVSGFCIGDIIITREMITERSGLIMDYYESTIHSICYYAKRPHRTNLTYCIAVTFIFSVCLIFALSAIHTGIAISLSNDSIRDLVKQSTSSDRS